MPYTPAWQQAEWQHPATPPTPGAPGATPVAGAPAPAAAPPQQTGILGQPPGPGAGGSPLHQWAPWMFSGGVDPNQWQNTGGTDPNAWMSLGGGPNMDFLGQFNQMLQGGANPTSVAPTTAGSMSSAMQPYVDTAYGQATRELDPQYAQAQKQFDQQMVNQGIAPGSEAYTTAKTQFDQGKNDAYSQAMAQAQQAGLAAQGQAFGQGLSQSQLSSQLAQALLGSNTSIANQQLGGNASITNAMLGGNQGLMQALLSGNSNIAQQLIGGQATRDAASSSAGASMYGAGLSHDLGQQNIDNGLLEWMLSGGQGVNAYNNGLDQQYYNNNANMLHYAPNGGQGGNIDVNSPYNNQYNGQMNQYNYQSQQANQQNQAYMQMMMAMFG